MQKLCQSETISVTAPAAQGYPWIFTSCPANFSPEMLDYLWLLFYFQIILFNSVNQGGNI